MRHHSISRPDSTRVRQYCVDLLGFGNCPRLAPLYLNVRSGVDCRWTKCRMGRPLRRIAQVGSAPVLHRDNYSTRLTKYKRADLLRLEWLFLSGKRRGANPFPTGRFNRPAMRCWLSGMGSRSATLNLGLVTCELAAGGGAWSTLLKMAAEANTFVCRNSKVAGSSSSARRSSTAWNLVCTRAGLLKRGGRATSILCILAKGTWGRNQ